MRKDTFVYTIGNKAYINLTNRCTNACDFCIRNYADGVEDYYLWLSREPSVDEIIALLPDVTAFEEIVFCGYGEPTMRADDVVTIARYIKANNGKTRINTNGQAELITGDANITKKFADCIDVMSISLNEATAEKYDAICHSKYGKSAYAALIDFARHCVEQGIRTKFSVMETIGTEDIEKCREIANSVGAELRVRTMI